MHGQPNTKPNTLLKIGVALIGGGCLLFVVGLFTFVFTALYYWGGENEVSDFWWAIALIGIYGGIGGFLVGLVLLAIAIVMKLVTRRAERDSP